MLFCKFSKISQTAVGVRVNFKNNFFFTNFTNTNIPENLKTIFSTSDKSSVIRQKGESQNGCFKKTNHIKFSEEQTFHKSSFFGKLACCVFLKHPFEVRTFIIDEISHKSTRILCVKLFLK